MVDFGLLALFFAFTLISIAAAGYFMVIRNEAVVLQGDSNNWKDASIDFLKNLGRSLPTVRPSNRGIREMLVSAGYRSPEAPTIFNGLSYATGLLIGLIAAFLAAVSAGVADAGIAFIAGAGFGYLLPKRLLDSRIAQRKRKLAAALPTALDLLVLSVEAGQALDQAIADAAREIRRTYPDLAEEFAGMSLALRASASREQVFKDFGARSQEPELRKLANLLIDSDRFGTSLAPTLRTHARYLRVRRRQQAQERARRVSVKLVFPIFFLVFPSVLLVTLGPAIIQIMQNFSGMFE
ncbi:MAG TPA: type II secretion system F family protein [Bryobacteraceae bacterium]|jgi:tight adherence protein C|nr:type II secretion system F family protein [Bryobacteraceae bacterium]